MPKTHFKSELSVGFPGDRLGDTNVQRGSANPTDWDILCKTHDMGKGWRTTLDPGQWMSYSASNGQRWVFRKKFINQHPLSIALQADGKLEVLNTSGHTIWTRGPYGHGNQWKLTAEENGDIVLRNAEGAPVWSAIADPGMHDNL